MEKRKIWISVAVLAGLVILFFVGRTMLTRQKTERAEDQDQEQAARALTRARQTLHQVCQYADSVGVDTSRYALASTMATDEVTEKVAQLLMEVRYGKKPSRIEFSGLPEAIDSSWVAKMDTAFSATDLTRDLSFTPYNQLVKHYSRLRSQKKGSPAVADSLRLIRQTLNFYRYINRFDPDKFVVVNIPAGELNVFDRGGTAVLTDESNRGQKR